MYLRDELSLTISNFVFGPKRSKVHKYPNFFSASHTIALCALHSSSYHVGSLLFFYSRFLSPLPSLSLLLYHLSLFSVSPNFPLLHFTLPPPIPQTSPSMPLLALFPFDFHLFRPFYFLPTSLSLSFLFLFSPSESHREVI